MVRKRIKNKRLYLLWHGMKQRCYNKKNPCWIYYGEKGIVICNEWLSYENFYEWAIKNGYEDNLSIDRIDNKKNYEPSNCRWISKELNAKKAGYEQGRRTLCVETGKIFDTITEARKSVGLKHNSSIYQSIKEGSKAGGYTWKIL